MKQYKQTGGYYYIAKDLTEFIDWYVETFESKHE